jgi:hypothetical protein
MNTSLPLEMERSQGNVGLSIRGIRSEAVCGLDVTATAHAVKTGSWIKIIDEVAKG